MKQNRTISVDPLARVEGEGALRLTIEGDRVTEAQLKIFEPPRFFEAFLRGRRFDEAPDITARICGICPVAYQMSAVTAIEDALGVHVDPQVAALRRLLYCGEWIQSHALHVYMLHAPDFLGYEGGLEMASDHPEVVARGLALKKVGNEVMALLGGRAIHPVNVRVGGFYRVPTRRELDPLVERLEWAREAARQTVEWTASFPCPSFERPYEFVALQDSEGYPFLGDRVVSTAGLAIPASEFESSFVEHQAAHSTALHARLASRGTYLVGPLARYALSAHRLSAGARAAAQSAGLAPVCRNPFRSIVVRSVEILHACEEGLRLIADYEKPDRPAVDVPVRAATGYGCTEAPRGLLYHRYTIDEQGVIREARIVPPTSQNLPSIEDDVRAFAADHLALPTPQLTLQCEQTIRNYDPCISCATHFLRLEINSGSDPEYDPTQSLESGHIRSLTPNSPHAG
jgi:coenzyme F420-reducing hydrogenase alpha subunit